MDIGRSREGAWIEMVIAATTAWIFMVAPVRERGLKLRPSHGSHMAWSRSREGAWIEISAIVRAGAIMLVAPVRERGLKLVVPPVLA